MSHRRSGRMTPAAWIAVAAAIFASLLASAGAQTAPRIERVGDAGARSVVLIPGLATPGAVWDGTVAALDGEADMHVVTLPGFGGEPPADYGDAGVIGTAVTALIAHAEAEGLNDLVLVGHSMGGQIALQIAAAMPDRVDAVIVVDSAPFYAGLFNPAATPEMARHQGAAMAAQLAGLPHDVYLGQMRRGLPVQSISAEGQAQVMDWVSASDQATVAAAFGEVAGADFSPVLPGVEADVTVLVAWADGVPVSAPQLADIYRSQYDGLDAVNIRVVEGSRHFIMLDRAPAFHDIVTGIVLNGEGE